MGIFSDAVRTRGRFFDSLATALEAGLPAPQALDTMASHGERSSAAIAAVVSAGKPLSAALAAQGGFDHFEIVAVEAGERAGQLPQVLRRLARALEVRGHARDRMAYGLMYPVLLIHGAILLPPLFRLFRDGLDIYLGTVLPVLGGIYVCFALLWWLHRGLTASDGGKQRRDALLLGLPWISAASQAFALAEYSHALSLLIAAGVPIPEALEKAAEATRNRVFRAAGLRAATRVRKGSTVQEALANEQEVFPQAFRQDVAVGESAGKLEETLEKAQETARQDAERWTFALAIAVTVVAYAVAVVIVAWAVISFWAGTTALPDGI